MKSWLALAGLCTVAFAANADGFKGPDNVALSTVAQVTELSEDAQVKLVGYIVKSLGDETFEFRDDTGTLVIEIDDDDWHGVEAGPSDRVEITGEVEREWRETGVEVDRIRLAN
jgi:uncharacterized protein (TIGR00156 family)